MSTPREKALRLRGLKWPGPGQGDMPSYMVSGVPWVYTGTHTADSGDASEMYEKVFDFVYSKILVKNNDTSGGEDIRVGFTSEGVQDSQYILLQPGEQVELHVRNKQIYLRANDYAGGGTISFSFVASLTPIRAGHLHLDRNIYDGV